MIAFPIKLDRSHFVLAPLANGGWLIEIRRAGSPAKQVFCTSQGHANRTRLKLSQDGLVGYVIGG